LLGSITLCVAGVKPSIRLWLYIKNLGWGVMDAHYVKVITSVILMKVIATDLS